MSIILTVTCCPHFKEQKKEGQRRQNVFEEKTGGTDYNSQVIEATFPNFTKTFSENLNWRGS